MTAKIIIDKDKLYDLYINQNKTKEEISLIFKVSVSCIKKNIKNFNFIKDKSLIVLKMQETCLAKYGKISYKQTQECKDKLKNNNLLKYGVDHYSKTKEYQDKLEKTNLERYGVKHYSNKEKMKKTLIDKYGVDNYSKLPECREKVKSTCFAKFGVDNYSKTKEYKEKIKSTNINRYGVKDYNQQHIQNYEIYIDDNLFIEKVKELKNTKSLSLFFNTTPTIINTRIISTNSRQYIEQFRSYPEIEIANILKEWNINFVCNTREIITPLELDFYIPEHKLAIEFNGDFWHSADKKDKKYHYNKTKTCEENGIRLIHIWEHEWKAKKDKLIDYLKDILKINMKKIYARQCEVKVIDKKECKAKCKDFLNKYHLQGEDRSTLKYGLYYNNELVSIMTWCKPRFNKRFNWELSRYAVKSGYCIVGGASKLFKHRPEGNLISYQNLSKFNGNVYEKLGFTLDHISIPNYVWCDIDLNCLSRYQCQMKNEIGVMEERGYYQVFDCGNKVWTYTR